MRFDPSIVIRSRGDAYLGGRAPLLIQFDVQLHTQQGIAHQGPGVIDIPLIDGRLVGDLGPEGPEAGDRILNGMDTPVEPTSARQMNSIILHPPTFPIPLRS